MAVAVMTLGGCSAALEQLRPTYDPSRVAQGATQAQIENELGKPVMTEPASDGGLIVTYKTSRVTPAEKKSVTDGHIEGSTMTLGVLEVFAIPSLLVENESRYIRITYARDGGAVAIASRCAGRRTNKWWPGIWPSAYGMACSGGPAPL